MAQRGWHTVAAAPSKHVLARATGFRPVCDPRAIADLEGARFVAGATHGSPGRPIGATSARLGSCVPDGLVTRRPVIVPGYMKN
jgi:hypothetical protein